MDKYIPGWILYRLPSEKSHSSCPVSLFLNGLGEWQMHLDDAPYSLHGLYTDENKPMPLVAFHQFMLAASIMLPKQGTITNGPDLIAGLHCPALKIILEEI